MMFDPGVFAVKSYLHFRQERGEYLKKILSRAYQPFSNVTYWRFH
jgi:hypothetical protein